MMRRSIAGTLAFAMSSAAYAGVPLGAPLGVPLGGALGITVGTVLPIAGGGLLLVGATSLALGIWIARRKQKR
jgi:hypothetical protein